MARSPDPELTLPYLVWLPLGERGVVLKVKDTWPRTAKVYCHPSEDWPEEPEVLERVPVRSCRRRGAAVDLVLDRGRENRSQFVFTVARGREVIFWQSARTSRQARPNVNVPTRRAAGQVLDILVDTHERYPWNFARQQASTQRRALRAGDYAVEVDGRIVAAVERKSLADLVSTITTGKLRYLLAALADVPRAAVVVEDRYSQVFRLTHARPSAVAESLAEAQVRFPSVPIVFCETDHWPRSGRTGSSAQASSTTTMTRAQPGSPTDLPSGPPVPPAPATPAPATPSTIRAWAAANGHDVSDRGKIPAAVRAAFDAAHAPA